MNNSSDSAYQKKNMINNSNDDTTQFISNIISGNSPNGQFVSSYNLAHTQNELLKNNIKHVNQMYSTDNQNILYQMKKIENYKYFNKILVIIYFILMGISTIFIFKTKKISSWVVKIIIVILLVIYPFIIYYLESYLYNFFSYMVAFLNGETYKKTMIPSFINTQIKF